MSHLVLVRHGESRWNNANKFTGWVDVPLSEVGIQEAILLSKKLQKMKFDVAFTSKLSRAQMTLILILSEQKRTGIFIHEEAEHKMWKIQSNRLREEDIPIYTTYLLNERYYGILQGMDKDVARKKYGKKQVHEWRRSYTATPPMGESLQDTYHRAVPYFEEKIIEELKKKKNVIVCAHGNTLRAVLKYIENIPDEDIPNLSISTAQPIIYKYTRGKFKLDNHGFEFSFNRPIYWEAPQAEKDNR